MNIKTAEYKIYNNDKISTGNLSLPELSAMILELAEKKDRITLSYIVKNFDANINTIKKHLVDLVKQKYIAKHCKTRRAWYTKN